MITFYTLNIKKTNGCTQACVDSLMVSAFVSQAFGSYGAVALWGPL